MVCYGLFRSSSPLTSVVFVISTEPPYRQQGHNVELFQAMEGVASIFFLEYFKRLYTHYRV
jgi:hypothetical protein